MRSFSIVLRIILQILHDRRTLVLLFFAPLFVMTLIYLLLGNSSYVPKIAAADLPLPLTDALKEANCELMLLDEVEDGLDSVREGTADALLQLENGQLKLTFESNDAVKTEKTVKAVQEAIELASGFGSSSDNSAGTSSKAGIAVDYLYGEAGESLFVSMGYRLLAVIVFFIVFILSGISFLRERTSQTLERLMLTPVKKGEVIAGYTLGFGLFAVLQSALLLFFVHYVLKMPIAGSVGAVGLVLFLLALSSVSIGTFISLFSNTEFQMVQFIPIIIIPQIFFCGILSLDTLPFNLGYLSRIMPVYYAAEALKLLCIRGEGLVSCLPFLAALTVFICFFSLLNIAALGKYREG